MAVLDRNRLEQPAERALDGLDPLAEHGDAELRPPSMTAFKAPSPPRLVIGLRLWRWLIALTRLGGAIALDMLRRKDTVERRAVHVRKMIVSMGPMAIQVAQQLAMRPDVLPLAYAAELSQLKGKTRPIRLAHVFARIRAATGSDVATLFETLDPEPIFADSISCLYQAVLRNGEKVTIRVLRPGVVRALSTERVVLDLLLRIVSQVVDVRVSYIRNLRAELESLAFEPVNFTRVARVQGLFRREARKHRLKYLSAAKIRFYSADVIISEAVSGMGLDEIMAAVANNDEQALARLKELKISPRQCGRRLLHACWWGLFEATMFSNLDDASQIIVEPGGRMVFCSLGNTDNLGRHHRRLLTLALERLARHNVQGAVELLLHLFLPLPRVNIDEFTKTMENRIWTRVFRMENRHSPWWERSGTALWLDMLETAREYSVPVSMGIVRMMQSSCLFDEMASRLHPDFRVFKEFRRYRRESERRKARLVLRAAAKQRRSRGVLVEEAGKVLEQLTLYGETVFEKVPIQFAPVAKKSAYFVMQVLALLVTLAKLSLVMFVGRIAYHWYQTRDWQVRDSIEWVLSFPGYTGLAFFFVILTLRRLLFRMSDIDQDD